MLLCSVRKLENTKPPSWPQAEMVWLVFVIMMDFVSVQINICFNSNSLAMCTLSRKEMSESSLDVGEAVSGDDGLGGDTADGDHGKTAVEELSGLLLVHASLVLGGELSSPGKV